MPALAEMGGATASLPNRQIHARRRSLRTLFAMGTIVAMPLAATACGDDDSEPLAASSSTTIETSAAPQTSTTAELPVRPRLTFDDLDAEKDAAIRVYAGPDDTEAARVVTGTFNPGDVVPAICKASGRLIKSRPEMGDTPKESDQWVRVEGTPDEMQWATMTYATMQPGAYEQLPDC